MVEKNFKKFIREKRAWYKKIKKVYCPCLKQDIIFNSKGFYHLRYDSHGKMRAIKEQRYKINLLPLAIPVIKRAKLIDKYTKLNYTRKFNKHTEYWALKEVVGKRNVEVKVILRKIGNGNITFFSIMKKRGKKTKKIVKK